MFERSSHIQRGCLFGSLSFLASTRQSITNHCHEAACRVSSRLGTTCYCDTQYPGHAARVYQADQVQEHSAASVRDLPAVPESTR
jgi:hypothetical protein